MKTQTISNRQAVINGILYATGSVTAIWLTSLLTLDSNTKYSGNVVTTALTFSLLTCGIILCIKKLHKIGQANYVSLERLLLAGLIFSLIVGLTAGLSHYINATFVDTHFSENSLRASQAKWAANHYSREAIAGQVELTDTFQRPWKWAVTSGIVMTLLTFFLFVFIGCFKKVVQKLNNGQLPE